MTYNQKVTGGVKLSNHPTNITLFSKYDTPNHPRHFGDICIPFIRYDISYDYILNIIAQANMVKMDIDYPLNTHDISS